MMEINSSQKIMFHLMTNEDELKLEIDELLNQNVYKGSAICLGIGSS